MILILKHKFFNHKLYSSFMSTNFFMINLENVNFRTISIEKPLLKQGGDRLNLAAGRNLNKGGEGGSQGQILLLMFSSGKSAWVQHGQQNVLVVIGQQNGCTTRVGRRFLFAAFARPIEFLMEILV